MNILRHIMVDLETLGTRSGCALVAIGAVAFDPAGTLPPLDEMARDQFFYVTMSPRSNESHGLRIEAGAMEWWFEEEPRTKIMREMLKSAIPIDNALDHFRDFLVHKRLLGPIGSASSYAWNELERHEIALWGHGASFDPVLLESAWRQVKRVAPPWAYRNIRDTRTVFDLVGGVRLGNDHHALRDAYNQAVAVQKAIARINITPPAASATPGGDSSGVQL